MIEAVKNAISLRAYLAEHGIEGKGKLYRCIGRDHEDRNPSGWIYQGRDGFERLHCGGCGLDIDVIGAAQELLNLDFRGALKLLADSAGIRPANTRAERAAADKARMERESRAAAVRAFRKWEQSETDEISEILRRHNRLVLTSRTFTEAELMDLAELQGNIDTLTHYYEILCSKDDESKFGLYREAMSDAGTL